MYNSISVLKKCCVEINCEFFLDSSLNYDCLELAFTRDDYDGLYALLSERNIATGKPRVSKCHKIIQKLVDYFAQIKIV